MSTLINLLVIIGGLALTYFLVTIPERLFVKVSRIRRLLIWQYRIEFPGRLWIIIVVGILQPIFAVASLILFFNLISPYLTGDNPVLPNNFLVFAMPVFFLGFFVPVGVVEMIAGQSVQVWGRLIKFYGVRIDDDYRKCGMARIFTYCLCLVVLFVATAILRTIYG